LIVSVLTRIGGGAGGCDEALRHPAAAKITNANTAATDAGAIFPGFNIL
jgi:hypothetical protein